MGETRVDLHHLLEDLRDAYPGSIEETIITEMVANALDSGATRIDLIARPEESTITVVDNGSGMQRRELVRYHDIAATAKRRGRGIGFAGVGIKLGLLVCEEVFTETRRGTKHVATTWRLSSKRRAPWKWTAPAGLVEEHGTAVRLKVESALSALLDPGYIERTLHRQFEPLLDATFDEYLSSHYPEGVAFTVNGQPLFKRSAKSDTRADIVVKLPRKRKPSAMGFVHRQDFPLAEDDRGVAISTFGKVIKRGWDWLGVSPTAPNLVGGLIEAAPLAECLTLNKADFIRSGRSGATYLAYRKAIQEAVSRQLAEWGVDRDRSEREQRRAARPVERELERVLIDLADDFPLVSTLVERRSGGQRLLPMGVAGQSGSTTLPVAGPEARDDTAPPHDERAPESEPADSPARREPEPPTTTLEEPAKRGRRRPTKYRLSVQFESRPDDPELARLVESTVWVNDAHPAYTRALSSRSTGYHIALSCAMALARLAVDPAEAHTFITAFLGRWGEATQPKKRRRRN